MTKIDHIARSDSETDHPESFSTNALQVIVLLALTCFVGLIRIMVSVGDTLGKYMVAGVLDSGLETVTMSYELADKCGLLIVDTVVVSTSFYST